MTTCSGAASCASTGARGEPAAAALAASGADALAAKGAGAGPATADDATRSATWAAPRRRTIGLALETFAPTSTSTAVTVPARGDGISIDALSLSTVIRLCSAATTSPGLTSTSITSTSAKSPMSGTAISSSVPASPCARGVDADAPAGRSPPAATATRGVASAPDAGADAGAGAAVGSGAGRASSASPAVSSSSKALPSDIRSPSFTRISRTTPADGDGISIDALSLSTVTRLCSARMACPTPTRISMTSTSAKSPMFGTTISTA